jgi:transcriptional antiterminator Rof (Rho-off)
MISTVPHSVVLLKMKDGADIEAAKKAVAENADPQKWICVGVSEENVVVESVGNYIILIMDDNSQKFRENFLASMK